MLNIKKNKTEIEFENLDRFDVFEYKGEIYLKLPQFNCLVANIKGEYDKCRINAVKIDKIALSSNYTEFINGTKVKPLKAELNIYE